VELHAPVSDGAKKGHVARLRAYSTAGRVAVDENESQDKGKSKQKRSHSEGRIVSGTGITHNGFCYAHSATASCLTSKATTRVFFIKPFPEKLPTQRVLEVASSRWL
jgi:hypothetical protein